MVPFLVMQKHLQGVKWLAMMLEQDWLLLLQTCMPDILTHILPWFAVSKKQEDGRMSRTQQDRVNHANACYELLVKHISHKVGHRKVNFSHKVEP